MSKQLTFSILVALTLVACQSTPERQPDQQVEQEESQEAAQAEDLNKLAIVWTSDDGQNFKTKAVAYGDSSYKVLAESNDLLLWANGPWWIKTADYTVTEGNCATKGGTQEVKKLGLYLTNAGPGKPARGQRKQLGVTDPRNVPNAEYTQQTYITGSAGPYVFAQVCSDYEYCYGPRDLPECEFVAYDLSSAEQVMPNLFIDAYPFEQQMMEIFPAILSEGGAMSGDRWPTFLWPRWDADGEGSWYTLYRVRVTKRVGHGSYVEETTGPGTNRKQKMEVPSAGPLGKLLSESKYSGFIPMHLSDKDELLQIMAE